MSKNDGSKESGRGETPACGMIELMQMMVEDNRRRDGELKRRDELDRIRREEEAQIREDERCRSGCNL